MSVVLRMYAVVLSFHTHPAAFEGAIAVCPFFFCKGLIYSHAACCKHEVYVITPNPMRVRHGIFRHSRDVKMEFRCVFSVLFAGWDGEEHTAICVVRLESVFDL